MNNANIEFKENLLNTGLFKYISNGQYKCKTCPFCNDMKYHMYVKINLDDDTSPVLFNCFKCNHHGVLNNEFLSFFGIDNIKIPKMRYTRKIDVGIKNVEDFNIDMLDDDCGYDDIKSYISMRVGVDVNDITINDIKYFQYVPNAFKYANEYLGNNNNNGVRYFNNRYWFRMTNGNICGRLYNNDENNNYRWIKYKPNVKLNNSGIYTIKCAFDLHNQINVYIAEGVIDVISLYYNYIKDNSVYIATLSSNYSIGLKYLINMGIFGKSVNVKIFKDNDQNNIMIDNRIRKLFNKIEIYHNTLDKDVGVPSSRLDIQKCIE